MTKLGAGIGVPRDAIDDALGAAVSPPRGDIPSVMQASSDAIVAASCWEDGRDVTERGAT